MSNPRLTVLVVGATGSLPRSWSPASHLMERCAKASKLVATQGPAQHDLDVEFARLGADPPGALEAVHDLSNMPLQEEPQRVRRDLDAVKR